MRTVTVVILVDVPQNGVVETVTHVSYKIMGESFQDLFLNSGFWG